MPVHGFEFLELGEIHRGADHGPVDDGRQEATDFQSSEDGIRLAGQSLDELDHDIARAMEFVSSYQQGHNLVGFEDSEEMRVRGGRRTADLLQILATDEVLTGVDDLVDLIFVGETEDNGEVGSWK